jgi:hypothetical protein
MLRKELEILFINVCGKCYFLIFVEKMKLHTIIKF